MSDLAELRSLIAAGIGDIPAVGAYPRIRVADHEPDVITPPAAYVGRTTVERSETYGRTLVASVPVVIVADGLPSAAQRWLDVVVFAVWDRLAELDGVTPDRAVPVRVNTGTSDIDGAAVTMPGYELTVTVHASD